MRYLVIDPFSRTITEHDFDGQITYREICQAGGFDIMTIGFVFDDGHTLYVDDNGLLRQQQCFFAIDKGQPLAGKGVVVGPEKPYEEDEDQPVQSATVTVDDLRSRISWHGRMTCIILPPEEHDVVHFPLGEAKMIRNPVIFVKEED